MSDISTTSPGQIFISYRRDETAYPAGWLYDRLADHFGADKIFKDIDSIEFGDDFVEVITAAVGSCDVLLALIGEEWLTITGQDGKRRLDDPADFVRVEIEAALARDVRVIPVLVDGASMPRAEALPASLRKLVRRHALTLSPSQFDFDTGRLLRVLDRTLAEVQAEVAAIAPPPPESTALDKALPPPPSTPAPPAPTDEAPPPTAAPSPPPVSTAPDKALPPPPSTPAPPAPIDEALPWYSRWRRTRATQLGHLSTRTRIVAVEAALVVLLLLIVAAVVIKNDSTTVEIIPTGAGPFRIATTEDGIWVTNSGDTTVDRIDPDTNRVVQTIDLPGDLPDELPAGELPDPVGIAANPDGSGVWVADFANDMVYRVDPHTNQVVAWVPVGNGPRNIAATNTDVWVTNHDENTVSRINVAANEVGVGVVDGEPIDVGLGPRGIVATDTDVWVANTDAGTVSHIRVNVAIEVVDYPFIGTRGEQPNQLVLTAEAVWVSDASQSPSPGRVIKINRDTNEVDPGGEVEVGNHPGAMASTDDTVYVANSHDDTVYAIDAATSKITDRFQTGVNPEGLAVTDTDLWVANTEDDTVSRIPLS